MLFCLWMMTACGLTASAAPLCPDTTDLSVWRAGCSVEAEAVALYGVERCFAASPVPDGVWMRMQGKSYQPNDHIGREDLCYLRVLHWDYDERTHLGEMVCNKLIAQKLLSIFRQLYEARYPIERMVLPDVYGADDELQMRDNNTSCFCYRPVARSAQLSKHAQGLAVDLNPLYNPYYKKSSSGKPFIQPATAEKYCDRSRAFRYKIDRSDLAYRLFTAHGFKWGGAWRSCKDYQHFEF